MENTFRWVLVTAIAPIAWGTNYFVTHEYLPAGYPLYGAVFRALPAGLLLLCIARRLPHGAWWWRSFVLGICNMSAFFALIYVAAQLLPVSLASTIMSASPVTMALFAWALLAERPTLPVITGAAAGLAGVWLMLGAGTSAVDLRGVAASIAALLMSSCGYVLTKKWGRAASPLATTAWQLTAGGLALIPFAALLEGTPPAMDLPAFFGFAYVGLIATALAFTAWFSGLRHLPATTVGLIGLLNPVTGVLLGTTLSAETLTPKQLLGLALVLAGITLSRPRRGSTGRAPSGGLTHESVGSPTGFSAANPSAGGSAHQRADGDCQVGAPGGAELGSPRSG